MKQLISLRPKLMIILFGIIIAMAALVACNSKPKTFQAPLFSNLGNYWVEATTDSHDANRFFVQGLLMSYGFNHNESARSFREAIRLDSTFAMAYWGLAYVLGPNYNLGMSEEDQKEVLWAARKAKENSGKLLEWEKALIATLEVKYPADSKEADEESYALVMEDLAIRFPDNPNLLTLAAEAQMNIHAWDLYDTKGGQAKEWTPRIVDLLEKSIALDSLHPLANHLYIHATEASRNPEIGNDAAGKLKTLVPGSGHLVHMPSHTYINTGEYHLGSLANEQAVIVDSTYIAQCKAQGAYPQLYYPHNYHFLAACAALEGRGARSIEAASIMAEIIDQTYLGKPGYETTQHFLTTPYNVLVKFAQWEKIMSLPKPDTNYPYLTAIWSYSRGMAMANTGRLTDASHALENIQSIYQTGELEVIGIFDINTAQDVAGIAIKVLGSEIADKNQKFLKAEKLLLEAVMIEDGLNYNEPPDWFFSTRHLLGDLYLRQGKYNQAERIYREDLVAFPKNGFALNGLYHSLKGQKKSTDAARVLTQFRDAWQYADSNLLFSRIDETTRTDLVLEINEKSPTNLIYIASSFCGF